MIGLTIIVIHDKEESRRIIEAWLSPDLKNREPGEPAPSGDAGNIKKIEAEGFADPRPPNTPEKEGQYV
jgi:hypothetical protein